MDKVNAEIVLTNDDDMARLEDGRITKDRIRSMRVLALVDPEAIMNVLPKDIVEALGLRIVDQRTFRAPGDQEVVLDIAGGFTLGIAGRTCTGDCLVGPPGCTPRVGSLVLLRLDLVIDHAKKTVTVHPDSPVWPRIKVKRFRTPNERAVASGGVR